VFRNFPIFGQPSRRAPPAALNFKCKCGVERPAINPSLSARNDLQHFARECLFFATISKFQTPCQERNRPIFLRLIRFCREVEYSVLQVSPRLRSFSLQPGGTKTLFVTALLGVARTVGIAFGLRTLLAYESTPGTIGAVPRQWPSTSQIERLTDRPTLVMLVHPRYPCTRASVAELAQLMARMQGKVDAYVLFLKPRQSGIEWDDTDLRRSAAAIPSVRILSDVDGVEARRFGAETSGHTLLFDLDGRLLFSGGITEFRGHAADNTGERSIESLVNGRTPARTATSVFGCALVKRSQEGDKPGWLK